MALAVVYYLAVDCGVAVLPYNLGSAEIQQPSQRALVETYLHGQAWNNTDNCAAEYGAIVKPYNHELMASSASRI